MFVQLEYGKKLWLMITLQLKMTNYAFHVLMGNFHTKTQY